MKTLLNKIVELEDRSVEIVQPEKLYACSIDGIRIGKIFSIKEAGQILVDYSDNPFDPLNARALIDVTSDDVDKIVLLSFENNDPKHPIIVGLIRNKAVNTVKKNTVMKNKVNDVIVDGKKIVFDAEKEIELRCGKSSLIMRKNGRIVIKGKHVVSRASSVNKIKGAAVRIN